MNLVLLPWWTRFEFSWSLKSFKDSTNTSGVTEYPKTGYSTNIRLFWRYSKPTFQNWIHLTAIRIQPQYSTVFVKYFFIVKLFIFGVSADFLTKKNFFSIFPKKVLKVPTLCENLLEILQKYTFIWHFKKEINLELIFYKISTF